MKVVNCVSLVLFKITATFCILIHPESDIYALRDSPEVLLDPNLPSKSLLLTYLPENLTIYEQSIDNSSATITLPCEKLKYGGPYLLTLQSVNETLNSDVLVLHWPKIIFETPNLLEIHRTGFIVHLSLVHAPCYAEDLEFKLELVFCGPKSDFSCTFPIVQDTRLISDLYSKKSIEVHYDCMKIGKPGLYFVELVHNENSVAKSDPIFAEINEDYFLSFVGDGIFPCYEDVVIDYNHPFCVSDRDRIRVHSRNFSSVPGFSYVAETSLTKRQRFATFPCDVFDEAIDEYCFTYVSVAVDGSATDLLEHCVPTWASTAGQAWSEWSDWSACSATCGTAAVKSRHRICEPTERRKFCKGSAVEIALCDLAPCYVTSDHNDLVENGNGTCSCGCSLTIGKPRTIYGSSQFCTGQLFWLLQTSHVAQAARVVITRSWALCNDTTPTLRLRDGPSLSSDLLVECQSSNCNGVEVVSSSNVVLLEFSTESSDFNCTGFFILDVEEVDVTAVKERYSRWVDDPDSSLSPPEIFGMVTLVAIFSGIFILAAVYSRFGLNEAQFEKPHDIDETATLVSSVSIGFMEEKEEKCASKGNERTYVPVLKDTLRSLPNTPLLQRSIFLGTLRKSLTFSPKTLRRNEYTSLAIAEVDKSSDSSLTLHENPLYDNPNSDIQKPDSDSKTISQAEISRCGTEQDFEMDYYDFDVENATQVPGSNFGTEPALIAWALQYVDPTVSYEQLSDIPMETMSQSILSTDTNYSTVTTAVFSNASDIEFADEVDDIV